MTETNEHDEMAETTSGEGAVATKEQPDGAPEGGVNRRRRTRERVSEKEQRIAEDRRHQAEEAFEDFRHLRDCPEEGRKPGDADSRVEFFPATRPRDEDHPPRQVLVLRCIECGEAEILPDETKE